MHDVLDVHARIRQIVINFITCHLKQHFLILGIEVFYQRKVCQKVSQDDLISVQHKRIQIAGTLDIPQEGEFVLFDLTLGFVNDSVAVRVKGVFVEINLTVLITFK